MQIQVGFRNNASEVTLEVDMSAEQLQELVTFSDTNTQTISDKSGRTLLIPPASLAYILINSQKPQKVGFGVG